MVERRLPGIKREPLITIVLTDVDAVMMPDFTGSEALDFARDQGFERFALIYEVELRYDDKENERAIVLRCEANGESIVEIARLRQRSFRRLELGPWQLPPPGLD